jgi:HEPN domain-containing protein
MSGRERAAALLARAAEDEALLDAVLDLPSVSDAVFGFHCQQAVEKLLKAVLAHAEVVFRRTHDLAELLDLATDSGIPVEPGLDAVRVLTPYAVDYRYGVLEPDADERSILDRTASRELVRRLRAWAEVRIGACPPPA